MSIGDWDQVLVDMKQGFVCRVMCWEPAVKWATYMTIKTKKSENNPINHELIQFTLLLYTSFPPDASNSSQHDFYLFLNTEEKCTLKK